MMSSTKNIYPADFKIGQREREKRLNQKPLLIWFTGLSGSGKSTLANETEKMLYQMGYKTYLLDGDNIRKGLNKDLGFSDLDRKENIRRTAEVCKLMLDAGLIVISAFISPFKKEREWVKELVGQENYVEIFVDCPLLICEQRDVKGLYKKAREGRIPNFTGIDSPYECPEKPYLKIDTEKEKIEDSIERIRGSIQDKLKQ